MGRNHLTVRGPITLKNEIITARSTVDNPKWPTLDRDFTVTKKHSRSAIQLENLATVNFAVNTFHRVWHGGRLCN